ncbi:MAG: ABC transporter permease [Ferruginibacter sp.]
MNFKDTISLSYKTIRSNKLRTAITVTIIALGIFALILIITAIQAASNSLTSSFSTMGANSFSIRFKERNIRLGGGNNYNTKKVSKNGKKEKQSNTGKTISYEEAKAFKERYLFPAKTSIAIGGGNSLIVNNDVKKTNPDVRLIGGDENYLDLNGYKISTGRNITSSEVETGRSVCIIGSSIAQKLYPGNPEKALDRMIKVDHIPYRVIAVLEDKGSSAFFNGDKIVITSYNNVRRLYPVQNASFSIAVMVPDLNLMNTAIGEAKGTMRPIRKLDVQEDDNFYIDKSDSIAEKVLTSLGFLKYGTIAIAFITLVGAAIGLMNIMLVAVNERTKEIGLIKALGGTRKDIRSQFIWESILISLMGAVTGILAGVALGNIVAYLLHTGLVIPWGWVIAGIFVCSLVGLLAGLYPAYKAARLDPIEALRYE